MRMRISIAAAAAMLMAGPAPAQAPAGPAVVATTTGAPDCELHVWPAERFNARTSGWAVGLGPIGALADASGHADGDAQRRTGLASALDSASQVAALGTLPLSTLLAHQPATIVLHGEPLDRKTVNQIKTRRAASAARCYSELIVADILYQKAALYGRSLHALFIYRQFDGAGMRREYKGQGGNPLKLFPPRPGEDIQAANDELVSVFKADFEEFARNAYAVRTSSD